MGWFRAKAWKWAFDFIYLQRQKIWRESARVQAHHAVMLGIAQDKCEVCKEADKKFANFQRLQRDEQMRIKHEADSAEASA